MGIDAGARAPSAKLVAPYRRCGCGHGVTAHGADMSAIGNEEFARRGRVAVRLDELLEVSGRFDVS